MADEAWWSRPALTADPTTPDEARLFVEELAAWLPRMKPGERQFLLERLAAAVPLSDAALPLLVSCLEDLESYDANEGDYYAGPYEVSIQDVAVERLTGLGGPAVPALIEALDHPNPQRRLGAAKALQCLGPPAAAAI